MREVLVCRIYRHFKGDYYLVEAIEKDSESGEDVEAEYIKVEVSQAVREAVRELKPEYAQAIWLVYFEDFTNPDAARIMKKTRHQFENLIYRARLALKRELERRGENEDLY